MNTPAVGDARAALTARGYVHLASMPLEAFDRYARTLGRVVGEERIALRLGAHAYVARPGPVPLHTDQPEVHVIGWWCEEQDRHDGAMLLLDARTVVESLPDAVRELLRQVRLATPPLSGGPPTMDWPVLLRSGDHDKVFCSPWLRSTTPNAAHADALATLRQRVGDGMNAATIEIRLERGEALFVNNSRMLHGRRAIAPQSGRALRRVWLRMEGKS